MYKKSNVDHIIFCLPIFQGKFLSFYAFFLLLIPFNTLAYNLTILSPFDNHTQKDNQIIEPSYSSNIKLKTSTKKDYKKEIATALWSNQQGFEFTNKYQENKLDWQNLSSALNFSSATWKSKIKLPIYKNLVVDGEFNIGKFTPQFKRRNYHINNRQIENQFNYIQDYQPTSQDLSNSNFNFGLKNKTSLINYGFNYSSIGSKYETLDKKVNKSDRAGFKYWGSKSFNDLTIETSYSTHWNNLNDDHDTSRITDNLIGIKASYTLSNWPYSSLSIGYQTGRRESSFEPNNEKHYSGDVNIISADFNISGDSFNISLGSSKEINSGDLNISNEEIIYNYISASFFSSGIYVTPSFYSSSSYYNNSNYVYKTLGSSLSFSYIPTNKSYNFSLYVNHDRNKSNDQYTFNDSFNGGASLDWKIKLAKNNQQIVTLKVESYHYIDHIYTQSNNSDLYFSISSQLVVF